MVLTDFFVVDAGASANCVFTINYGTACGAAEAMNEANIDVTGGSTTPYTLTYNVNILDGYGPSNVCVFASSTNGATD